MRELVDSAQTSRRARARARRQQSTRRDHDLLVEGTPGQAPGLQEADGLELRLGFDRDLDFLHTEEELRPFLEGEMPPNVTQNADACGTDVARYVAEGPGLSVYALLGRTV